MDQDKNKFMWQILDQLATTMPRWTLNDENDDVGDGDDGIIEGVDGIGDDDDDKTENNVVMLWKRELFDQRETRPTVRNQPSQEWWWLGWWWWW